MSTEGKGRTRLAGPIAALLVAGPGLMLILWAVFVTDTHWYERHILSFYFVENVSALKKVHADRAIAIFLGVVLVVLGVLAGRAAARMGGRAAARASGRIAIALLLALGVSEVVMRRFGKQCNPPPQEVRQAPLENRIGHHDARYGWAYDTSRTTPLHVAERDIVFAVNAEGFRARSQDDDPDPSRPTILVTGESIAVGHALNYDETSCAVIQARLGVQVVDLAMHGYANDQAYLRLADQLPKFSHLLAGVTFFLPAQLERDLQTFRPHLVLEPSSEGVQLVPPTSSPWWQDMCLFRLACAAFPYHSEGAVELARAIMRATYEKVKARGATPLFVIPTRSGTTVVDRMPEGWLIKSIFDPDHLPYLIIDWWEEVGGGDWHPSPASARRIGDAVAERLRADLGL